MALEIEQRDASVTVVPSPKSVLNESFATLVSRAAGTGIWKQRKSDALTFTFDFFELSKVKDLEPDLFERVSVTMAEPIAPANRYDKSQLLVLFDDPIGLDRTKEDPASNLWWIKKNSSAATFINLSLGADEIARRAATRNR